MKPAHRIGLTIIGLLALISTGAFLYITFVAEADKGSKLTEVAGVANDTLAAGAGNRTAREAPAQTPAEAPLVFDHPGASQAAHATKPQVQVFGSPAAGKPVRVLRNPTMEGMQLILGVKEQQGEWLKVQLPVRPNGTTGWVRKSDVSVKTVPNHIVVETAKRKLTVWNGDQLLFETPVGVGKAKTPTPAGTFYVDFSVRNPGPGYGVHMLSVAGFSNVLKNFGGGLGQIAIHGTNAVHTVGAFSSNGCLRLTNEAVTKLASIAAAGTPVYILP